MQFITSNNQRLRSVDDIDRSWKRFCSDHCCALRKLHVTDSKNIRDQITSDKGPNARDQIAFCAFHSFLVEVQSIATWR